MVYHRHYDPNRCLLRLNCQRQMLPRHTCLLFVFDCYCFAWTCNFSSFLPMLKICSRISVRNNTHMISPKLFGTSKIWRYYLICSIAQSLLQIYRSNCLLDSSWYLRLHCICSFFFLFKIYSFCEIEMLMSSFCSCWSVVNNHYHTVIVM